MVLRIMSALPPKADMCGALGDVRFVPIADIAPFIRSPRRRPITVALVVNQRICRPHYLTLTAAYRIECKVSRKCAAND